MLNIKSHPYSAIGDGTADDTLAIRQALADGKGKEEVYFPPGTYLISEPLDITNCRLRGESFSHFGEGGSIIRTHAQFKPNVQRSLLFAANAPCQVLDLHLDVCQLTDYGLRAEKCNLATYFANVTVSYAQKSGFLLDQCQKMMAERLEARLCDVGFTIRDCNASRFVHCKAEQNTNHGLVIERLRDSSHCTVDQFISECNDGHGIYVSPNPLQEADQILGPEGVNLLNCTIEANQLDGIRLEKCTHAILQNNRIVPSGSKTLPGYHCIRLIDCRFSRAMNCSAASAGNENFLKIKDENGRDNLLRD